MKRQLPDSNKYYQFEDMQEAIMGADLLGRGLSFDEAMAELQGVTLESIVIATRSARAVQKKIDQGVLKAEDFPLLRHIYEVIVDKKPVNVPCPAFEIESLG